MHLLAVIAIEPNQTDKLQVSFDTRETWPPAWSTPPKPACSDEVEHLKAKPTQITANVDASLDESTTLDIHWIMHEEEQKRPNNAHTFF